VKLVEKESQLKIMNKWQILFLSIAQIALDIRLTLGSIFPEFLLVKVFLLLPKVPGGDIHCPYV